MKRSLIDYPHTPQVIGLEYDEMRDLEKHPEKKGYYEDLAKARTLYGRDFITKAPTKKRRMA